jgi:hypothetical protein
MKTKLMALMMVLLAAFVALTIATAADTPPAPLGIVPTPPPGPGPELTVAVWTNKSTYAVGENVVIYYTVSQPAYIYLYDIQADGIVRLVFPNAYSQNNYVAAGTHTLPDGNYRFLVTPPIGLEQLQIIASVAPLPLTQASSSGDPFPMVAPSPHTATQELQNHLMGIVPVPGWATGWTSFTIISSSYPPSGYYPTPPSYPPFYPPFYWSYPGAYWYWEDGEWHYGTPGSGWYWYFGPDGKWHFGIRIQIGNDN